MNIGLYAGVKRAVPVFLKQLDLVEAYINLC